MKLTDFKVLTFDCYGTLIDWETGILNGLAPLAAKARHGMSRDRLLEVFAQHEASQEEETPAMPEQSPYDAFFALAGQDVVDPDAYKRLRAASMI